MATIAVIDYLALTDSIAAQVDLYKTSISGATGSAFFGADANLTRILAFDEFEQETELLRGFEAQKRQMQLTGMAVPGWNASVRALSVHVGGFNNYFDANPTAIVAPEFKEIADIVLSSTIKKAAVFSPVVNLGTWEPDGAGAGTFTDEQAIDNTLYPDAETEAIVLDLAIGAVALSMDVTFLTDGGGPFVVPVVVPALSAIGFVVAITPGTPYSNVSLIANGSSGDGNATDKVRIRSKRLRLLAL